MAYIPPHRRDGRSRTNGDTAGVTIVGLDSLISPDDSVSCVGSPARIPVQSLTERQVANLFVALGLGKYAESALSVPLRGRDLLHCTDEDLVSIGIVFRHARVTNRPLLVPILPKRAFL